MARSLENPNRHRSSELHKKAEKHIPGGVNSPVRKYKPYPLYVASGRGSRFTSLDGQDYLDYCMAYGALLDGHSSSSIVQTVRRSVGKGTVYGQPTEMEVRLAELITELVPSIRMVRFVNTGTEAAMHAVRLARGFTGRKKLLKFQGCFHGSSDSLLVKRGRAGLPTGQAGSAGILDETARNTLVANYNDQDMTRKIIQDYAEDLAAVIIEPIMGNMGPILPEKGFLETVQKETRENEVILIFDEVITGFRIAAGGAQEYYGIHPDLSILGKILGGGLPLAAFGGRREIMEQLAPLGPVYQAGTFNGNPLSVSAGITMLESIKKRHDRLYSQLQRNGERLRKGIRELIRERRVSAQVNGIGSMFQIFFTDRKVRDYDSAMSSNMEKYDRFFHSLLDSSIFLPPSQFETCFLSTAHSDNDLDDTLGMMDNALRGLA